MCTPVLNILQAQTRLQTGVAINMGTEQKPVCIVCMICTWLLSQTIFLSKKTGNYI